MKIAVFFGGKSSEHDISIITAMQVLKAINKNKYQVLPVYINKNGKWFTGNEFFDLNTYVDFEEEKYKNVILNLSSGELLKKGKLKFKNLGKIDCAFLCCHGLNGEDGTLQGVLELANIPYTSSGVLGSSVCMDKIVMKQILSSLNFPQAPYTWITREELEEDEVKVLKKILEKLDYPVIVKPANLGSSIGINKCYCDDDLLFALDVASSYDRRIIIEKVISPLREINCACKGYLDNVEVSKLEEPLSADGFLSFKEKYLTFSKSKMQKCVQIPSEVEEKIKNLTKLAFKALCCSGVIRVDFMLNAETNEVYLNEVNSIPGSMANYLFDQPFMLLIDELISFAFKRFEDNKKNRYSYKSTALINYLKNGNSKLKK